MASDDSRAGMSAVEIHISGTAERLDLVNMQAERIQVLENAITAALAEGVPWYASEILKAAMPADEEDSGQEELGL